MQKICPSYYRDVEINIMSPLTDKLDGEDNVSITQLVDIWHIMLSFIRDIEVKLVEVLKVGVLGFKKETLKAG